MNIRINHLPIDIWERMPLNNQDISQLRATCRFFSGEGQIKQVFALKKQVLDFLDLIFQDKSVDIQAYLNKHPELLFANVTYLTSEDSIETISPWQYAVQHSNQNIVRIFVEHIDKAAEFYANVQSKSFVSPETNILESYEQAVEAYHDSYTNWLLSSINDQEVNTAWLTLGESQKNIPLWIWKQFNSKLPDMKVFEASHYDNEDKIIIFSNPENRDKLGKEFTFVKGKFYKNRISERLYYSSKAQSSVAVQQDCRAMRGLIFSANEKDFQSDRC